MVEVQAGVMVGPEVGVYEKFEFEEKNERVLAVEHEKRLERETVNETEIVAEIAVAVAVENRLAVDYGPRVVYERQPEIETVEAAGVEVADRSVVGFDIRIGFEHDAPTC